MPSRWRSRRYVKKNQSTFTIIYVLHCYLISKEPYLPVEKQAKHILILHAYMNERQLCKRFIFVLVSFRDTWDRRFLVLILLSRTLGKKTYNTQNILQSI